MLTLRKGLTKKLNRKGWLIYRNSEVDLYVSKGTSLDDLGVKRSLDLWNINDSSDKVDWLIHDANRLIDEMIQEDEKLNGFDHDAPIGVRKI